jgi:hypothetical protein
MPTSTLTTLLSIADDRRRWKVRTERWSAENIKNHCKTKTCRDICRHLPQRLNCLKGITQAKHIQFNESRHRITQRHCLSFFSGNGNIMRGIQLVGTICARADCVSRLKKRAHNDLLSADNTSKFRHHQYPEKGDSDTNRRYRIAKNLRLPRGVSLHCPTTHKYELGYDIRTSTSGSPPGSVTPNSVMNMEMKASMALIPAH